jgi:hypothetical protein
MTDLSMPATTGTTSTSRVAELHRLCDRDYASNAARRAQDRRDDAHLIASASASEAVAGR